MAVLEGFAIAYVIGAAVQARGGQAKWLAGLAILVALTFLGVLVPSDFARMSGQTIYGVLGVQLGWMSSFCTIAATFTTLAAIGFAEAVYGADANERAALQAQAQMWHTQHDAIAQKYADASAEWRDASVRLQADNENLQGEIERLRAQVVQLQQEPRGFVIDSTQRQGRQYAAKLRALWEADKTLTQQQLANAMGVPSSTIGRNLEAAGLRRNGDGMLHPIDQEQKAEVEA
jgi:plasmid maintenance system antidote protein VapI